MSEDGMNAFDDSARTDDVIVDDVVTTDDDIATDADDELLVLQEAQTELPVWEPTGDAEVDAAIALLSQLDDTDLSGHVETFGQVHRQLRQRLTDVASG